MPPSTPQNVDQESSHHKKNSRSLKDKTFDPLVTSFQKLFRGTIRPKSSRPSKPVTTPQDSSTNISLDGKTEQPDPSLPLNSPAIEQSICATLQNAHHSSASENTRIVTIDQQNVKSQSTEREHIDPGLNSDQPTSQVASQAVVTMFQDAQHLNISGNARIMNIGHQHVNSRGNYSSYSNALALSSPNASVKSSQALDNLKEFVSFDALHDSSAQDPERCCHPGTRQNVLDEMRTWMDDPNALERILWLNGPAGVGKSAIAQTISNSYDQDKLGATFFFFRSDPVRNDGNRLFPTLAWQLALSVPDVNDLIAISLEKHPDVPRKAIEVQFNKLINQPFLIISGGESTAATSTQVIIIDGLDECSDVKLQQRILKIVGNAVADARFPLRFIISSRPEAHIEDFFSQFEHPTLQIDLANIEGAYSDIEIYLTSEFARIAVEQELDHGVWPGQHIIDALVSNSSGQFVYATTVMKCVGDKYESAVAQLNVILGIKPCAGKSPFAKLDALYTEILQRQTDQDFLREFLPVLVARSLLVGIEDGNLDDAMLLGLDEKGLRRKLRGMHSILKFEPFIHVHHKSFLDFLDDSSRSGEYHVSKHVANRRYMELITDLLVKAASRAMEQPDSHEGDHFKPRFAIVIKHFPLSVTLPLDDLGEILRPLLIIQENLLQLPNMSIPWKPRACDKCWTFYMIDDLLLHLGWLRGAAQLQEQVYIGIRPLTASEERQSIPELDLDACLPLLLASLSAVELPLKEDTIGLMRALVRFDPTETAMKVRALTDAQNLVDFICYLNKKECFNSWFGPAAHNATRLTLEICGRVPLLPRSLFLNTADLDMDEFTYQGKTLDFWNNSHTIYEQFFDEFVWGGLSHDNMAPYLGTCVNMIGIWSISPKSENGTLREWRQSANPSVSKIQQIVFEVAKAIQYVHSLGIIFRSGVHFSADDVYLDSNFHAQVQSPFFRINCPSGRWLDYKGQKEIPGTMEDNIFSFGVLFYRVLFNIYYGEITFNTCPAKPKIPDHVWQLIQWCWDKEPEKRPTIDQVVQEMESWISLGQFALSS